MSTKGLLSRLPTIVLVGALARIVQEACDASGGRGEGALSLSERRSPT
jgi:hypothetical protein